MIVDIEKYRRFTLNQRPCAPTQTRPIFEERLTSKLYRESQVTYETK